MVEETTTPVTPAPAEPVTPVVQTHATVTPVVPAPVATPVAQPITPVVPEHVEPNTISKAKKYIFQFPENTSTEKQVEYMQKVEDTLKVNDRVVIDPKVKIYEQDIRPTVAPVSVPPPAPTPVVNKVTVGQTDVKKSQEEFATLFLEE